MEDVKKKKLGSSQPFLLVGPLTKKELFNRSSSWLL